MLHLKKQRRQEFSSFFETLANISEFIAHGLQIFFFPIFCPLLQYSPTLGSLSLSSSPPYPQLPVPSLSAWSLGSLSCLPQALQHMPPDLSRCCPLSGLFSSASLFFPREHIAVVLVFPQIMGKEEQAKQEMLSGSVSRGRKRPLFSPITTFTAVWPPAHSHLSSLNRSKQGALPCGLLFQDNDSSDFLPGSLQPHCFSCSGPTVAFD